MNSVVTPGFVVTDSMACVERLPALLHALCHTELAMIVEVTTVDRCFTYAYGCHCSMQPLVNM